MSLLNDTPSSLIWCLGGSVAGIGLLLAVWALVWDRSRGRRRCPNCWYNMAGLTGLRCPECGQESSEERRLHRTRRSLGVGALGVVLLAGGSALETAPTVRAHGLIGLMPGFQLARLTPPIGQDEGSLNLATRSWELPPVAKELRRRIMADELAPSNMLAAIRKAEVLMIPTRLELGEPLVVGLRFPLVWTGPGILELVPRTPGLATVRAGQLYPTCGFSGTAGREKEAQQVVGVLPDGVTTIEFDVRVSLRRESTTPSRWAKAKDEWNYVDTIELGLWRVPIKVMY